MKAAATLKPLQLTLAIIKPHAVANPVALKDIQDMIVERDFKIVRSARQKLRRSHAEQFYGEHKGKFFYNRLVTFMSSGPLDLYILAHENAIQRWRSLMGPTKVFKTQYLEPDSIRGKYGLSDTRNATHGSDSEESAVKEITTFYPEFDIDEWYRNEEPDFRNCNLIFDSINFVHKVSRLQKIEQ